MITTEELQLAARLPLLTLGARANTIREAAHGNRAYFAPHPSGAIELAVPSNASPEEIALALLAVREQDPSSVEPRIVAMNGETTGDAEIRLIALARLALPSTTHIRANWTLLTDAMAQVALRFGADDSAASRRSWTGARSTAPSGKPAVTLTRATPSTCRWTCRSLRPNSGCYRLRRRGRGE